MSRLPVRLLTLVLAAARSMGKRTATRSPTPARPVQRILVAHYLLLGDTLLLAPLLAKLSRQYPHAERFVLARPAVAPLFSGQPYGFTALPYDPRDFSSFRRLLATGPFDLAFALGDNRYAWLARAAGARWIVGFDSDRPAWKNWMVDAPQPHAARPMAWADMAAALAEGAAPAVFRTGDWPTPAADQKLPAGPYAVLHVGASTPLKLWPAERWRALADFLRQRGITPVWSAGRDETALVDEILVEPPDSEQGDLRYCGRLSLPQLWQLLAGASLLVCPDTGIAHLGKLVGVPTVVLFGPGSPTIYGKGDFWRDAPYIGLAADPFPCRNQNLLFRRELDWVQRCGRDRAACASASAQWPCDPPTAPCMQAIGLAAVLTACTALLPSPKTGPS